MPFHQLAVAPADVDGAALGLALNGPAASPLVSIRLSHRRGGALVLLAAIIPDPTTLP